MEISLKSYEALLKLLRQDSLTVEQRERAQAELRSRDRALAHQLQEVEKQMAKEAA